MAGHCKDAIFVQLLLFHIAVYPIMLIYFNPGISLIVIGILEFIFIFQVSYFFEHLLSYTIWIYVIHPDGHGLAKRLSGATEWESLLNGFSVLSHFIVTVLWTLLATSTKWFLWFCNIFFDISTKWFYPKNNVWHHMINISFLPLY